MMLNRVLIAALAVALLLVACQEEAAPEVEPTAEESFERADDEPLPPELIGALTGRTVVVLLGHEFFDPEFYALRRLFNLAGAEVHAASFARVAYGVGGSDVRHDLDLERFEGMVDAGEVDVLYLMQAAGAPRLVEREEVQRAVRRQRELGGYLAASGIGLSAMIDAYILEGINVAPFRSLYRPLEGAGALIDENADALLDDRIGSAVFWPQGELLVRLLIDELAATPGD